MTDKDRIRLAEAMGWKRHGIACSAERDALAGSENGDSHV